MSKPPYRVLKVALRIFSVLLAIGALFMIFSSRALIVRVFLHPPEAEVSTLLLFLLKEMGGIVLMLSAMLFLASRDPQRNAAVVDGLIVGLVILSVTPLLSLYTVDIRRIYPGHLVWGRSVVRLAFAAFFVLSAAAGDALETCGAFLRNPCRGRGREGTVQPATFRFGWTQHKGYAVLLCLVATSHLNGHSAP